ncbi:Ig-like domain protein [Fowlpox virus]|nr:Ig-like domain protein [Fowlpox virus]
MDKNIIFLLLSVLSLSNCYKMVVYEGVSINMTCILPPDRHADNLIIVKGNIRNNTFIKTVKVENAGEEKICYCGDPASEYHIPLPNNTSSKDEGLYKCIFRYNGSETFRHRIELYVMPKVKVSVKEDSEQHRRYFYINRTRAMEDGEVSVKATAGGVDLGDYPLITVEYKSTHEASRITANTNYDDCAASVTFTVTYMGLLRQFIASVDNNTSNEYYSPKVLITENNNLLGRTVSKYSMF